MDTLRHFIDLFLHVDKHLADLIASYGSVTYVLLFLIVFCETGLIVTPFLPGDSLLFATGALCVQHADRPDGNLNVLLVIPLLIVAAVLGDAVNYAVGFKVGPGFLEHGKVRFIKMSHLRKTQEFYDKHGGKTIILARFMPIIRTFAPFVAGIGRMEYRRFGMYNITGAVAWVTSFTVLGFFFGNLPFVQKGFHWVIIGIVVLSVLPIAIEAFRAWRAKPEAPPAALAAIAQTTPRALVRCSSSRARRWGFGICARGSSIGRVEEGTEGYPPTSWEGLPHRLRAIKRGVQPVAFQALCHDHFDGTKLPSPPCGTSSWSSESSLASSRWLLAARRKKTRRLLCPRQQRLGPRHPTPRRSGRRRRPPLMRRRLERRRQRRLATLQQVRQQP